MHRMQRMLRAAAALALLSATPAAQTPPTAEVIVLRPARVFDGDVMHEGWVVRVRGARIDAVGPADSVLSPSARLVNLPGTTLTPGLIEGHSHVLLHAYSEASWVDQVSREGFGLRVARATITCARRFWPGSRSFAISAPKARAMPTSS